MYAHTKPELYNIFWTSVKVLDQWNFCTKKTDSKNWKRECCYSSGLFHITQFNRKQAKSTYMKLFTETLTQHMEKH